MIYLDNAATTKPSQKAVSAVINAMEQFGNPSSLHGLGLDAEKIIEKSRKTIADRLGVDKKTIYFTSGGTEANNLAIIGTARALKKRGNRIITSKTEHPSVLESFRTLENEGFEVIYINSEKSGIINLEELKNAVNDKTSLVSVMTVNNETGIIQPVEEIGKITHSASPFALFHTDAVQAFGKVNYSANVSGADLISVSSHKIHGPKGVGALYIGKGKPTALLHGGSQQSGIRPGTENVPGIAGFGAAAEEDYENCAILYDTLKKEISEKISDVTFNGDEAFASKFVLNASFIGIKAEVLLHTLERYGIYVSTGSACSSHKPEPSPVLTAMGASKKEIDGAIRFSFDNSLNVEDINKTVEILAKEIPVLRKYSR